MTPPPVPPARQPGGTTTEMQAGRELDALVAEKVMGYRVERVTPEWAGREVALFYWRDSDLATYSCDFRSDNACMYRNGVNDIDGIADPLPVYSEDITAAWQVMDEMIARGLRPSLSLLDDGRWVCDGHWDELHGGQSGETPALAICRAALAFVEAPADAA